MRTLRDAAVGRPSPALPRNRAKTYCLPHTVCRVAEFSCAATTPSPALGHLPPQQDSKRELSVPDTPQDQVHRHNALKADSVDFTSGVF